MSGSNVIQLYRGADVDRIRDALSAARERRMQAMLESFKNTIHEHSRDWVSFDFSAEDLKLDR